MRHLRSLAPPSSASMPANDRGPCRSAATAACARTPLHSRHRTRSGEGVWSALHDLTSMPLSYRNAFRRPRVSHAARAMPRPTHFLALVPLARSTNRRGTPSRSKALPGPSTECGSMLRASFPEARSLPSRSVEAEFRVQLPASCRRRFLILDTVCQRLRQRVSLEAQLAQRIQYVEARDRPGPDSPYDRDAS